MTNTHESRKSAGRIAAAALSLFAVLALTGCNSDTDDSKPSAPAATASMQPEEKQSPIPASDEMLPDLTGMNHQAAQDTAQSLGFYDLQEEDASGAGRMLLWDRNWTVCSQDPSPGVYSKDTTVTLHSVKIGESCP